MAGVAAYATCSDCGATFGVPLARFTTLRRWTPTRCIFCAAGSRDALPGLDALPASGSDALVFIGSNCLRNPGPGGWGLVHTLGGEPVGECSGKSAQTTHNRMELTAVLRAIRRFAPGDAATVYSRNTFVVQTATVWSRAWAGRGWTRRSGPISNLDLVQQLYAELQAHPGVRVELLPFQGRHEWAVRAEALALTAAKRAGGAA